MEQVEDIINIDVDVVCLDSTTIKVHPDACRALKKEENKQSAGRAAVLPRKSIHFISHHRPSKNSFIDGQSL